MQELALRPSPSAVAAAVLGVAADRVADRRQVRADLVRAAGLEAHAQQGRRRQALEHLEVGHRLARPVRARGHERALRAVAADRGVDGPAGGVRAALHQRQVLARELARLDHAPERARGPRRTSRPRAAPRCRGRGGGRCRRARVGPAAPRPRERLGERRPVVARARGAPRRPAGLSTTIRCRPRRRPRIGRRSGAAAGLRRRRATSTRSPAARRWFFGRAAVHQHRAGVDQPLRRRARAGAARGQEGVQAQPGVLRGRTLAA